MFNRFPLVVCFRGQKGVLKNKPVNRIPLV